MKLLDIMKKYDRCLVRESAKLTKIYNMLLKEAVEEDLDVTEIDLDEEKCPDCGKDPCVCDEEDKACDECGIIPEEEFIKDDEVKENDMLRNRPHNGHIDDPAGIIPESEFFAEAEKEKEKEKEKTSKDTEKNIDESDKTNKSDDEEVISAEEFFAEAEKECKDGDCSESDEQMMSAEEFFSSQNAEVPDESKSNSTAKDESEQKIDEAELNFIPAEEWIQQANEQSLEESLKSYRRKNHRLFNS